MGFDRNAFVVVSSSYSRELRAIITPRSNSYCPFRAIEWPVKKIIDGFPVAEGDFLRERISYIHRTFRIREYNKCRPRNCSPASNLELSKISQINQSYQ